MMEQSTQTNNIYERPKKVGQKVPQYSLKRKKKERARQRAIINYSLNFEKERERKRLEYHAKTMFKIIFV